MRPDMGKVITERPRRGSSNPSMKYRKSIRWEGFDADYHEPYRVTHSAQGQYGYNYKEFTDLLGPVKGYLDKQVGRPWDKVYSDICAVLDKSKLTHQHVITHITRDFVEITPEPGGFHYSAFFVHQKTGILCRRKKETKAERKARWAKSEKPKDEIKLTDGRTCKKVKGIWYVCQYKTVLRYDPFLKKTIEQPIEWKQQLNTKELVSLNLRNDVA